MRLCRLMLLIALMFLALYVIGRNGGIAVISVFKNVCLYLSGVCYIAYVVFFIKYLGNKERPSFVNYFNTGFVAVAAFVCIYLFGFIYKDQAFREWFVTTAMATMKHQFYCKIFYNETIIADVMKNNYMVEIDETVDTSLVNTGKEQQPSAPLSFEDQLSCPLSFDENQEANSNTNPFMDESFQLYANEFEEAIFAGHTDDEVYRMLSLEVNKQDAYLAVIYDPARVSVAFTKKIGVKGEYVVDMAKRTNALVAINGGRFKDVNGKGTGGLPKGVTISNNEIVSNNNYNAKYGIIGINQDNVLVLYKGIDANQAIANGVRDAVTSGPFLIINGKSSYSKGNGGYGYDARTIIGQRADGIMLLLVVDANDTRTSGASMVNATKIMQDYGAINAAALDGGTSSVMVENGVLISDPINSKLQHKTRPIATAIIVQ